MHIIKIILIFFFTFTIDIFAEKEKIVIRKLDLIGNYNISLKEILFIVRQRPPTFFLDSLSLTQDY